MHIAVSCVGAQIFGAVRDIMTHTICVLLFNGLTDRHATIYILGERKLSNRPKSNARPPILRRRVEGE